MFFIMILYLIKNRIVWDMGVFSGLLVSSRKNIIFFIKENELSPEIHKMHTQNLDDFHFQQTHVNGNRWIMCSHNSMQFSTRVAGSYRKVHLV